MEKNFLSDIIPPADKKTIRDVPVPERRRAFKPDGIESKLSNNSLEEKEDQKDFKKFKKTRRRKKMGFKFLILLILIVTVLFAITASFFKQAGVIVTVKKAKATVDTQIAIAENGSESATENTLLYKLIEVSETKSQTVLASGESKVQIKASGIITISNEYSKDPQKLVANTRFKSEDGLIYRIPSSINVPGYSEKNGQKVPGQIDVRVNAEETGEKYNIESTNFTVPGFESSPQMFKGFSAKVKEPIAGGYNGVKKIVSEEQRKNTEQKLKQEITEAILNKIKSDVDKNTIVVQNPESFIFSSLPDEELGSEVKISVKGILKTEVFDKYSLSKLVTKEYLGDLLSDERVLISNIENLNLSVANDLLKIEGKADFVWEIDEKTIKKTLAGIKEKDISNVVKNVKGVESIESSIVPFWFSSLPKDSENIDVKIK